MKTITIAPVTRIEGHAKVTINLDDSGNVADTFVNVVELRGFEKFCIGRPVEELPRIVTSICGVCPWHHHLASAKANDVVFGVTPPPTGIKLRDLCQSIACCSDKILHFFFLAGPDFVMGPDADYSVRNVMGIAQANPDLGKKVIRARYLGTQMLNIASGKAIHPVTAVPGGFSKPLTEAERDELVPMAEEMLEFAKFAIEFAKNDIFPKYLDAKARLMKPDGTYEEFSYDQYTEYIGEHIEPWSYLKFPYAKKWGDFDMSLESPVGIYRTNALARINVCDKMATPLAQKELEEFREKFGRPAITGKETRVPVTPRAARGIGCVEAPRGTLIHDYETDEKGLVTNVNLIVGTTHNNAPINMSVKQTAKALIKDGKYDEATLDKIEMAIRAYDPCLSCATHKLDGTIAVKVEIRDSSGKVIETMAN